MGRDSHPSSPHARSLGTSRGHRRALRVRGSAAIAARRSRASSPGKRSRKRSATIISLTALVASIAAVGVSLYPYFEEATSRQDVTIRFLERLTGVEWNDALRARTFTARGSDAELFAGAVNRLWLAGQYTGEEFSQLNAGTVTQKARDEYELCFPKTKLTVFSDDCFVFSHFEYNESDRITRFAVDGVAVESLLTSLDLENDLTSDEGGGPIDALDGGAIYSPDGSEKIVILSVRHVRGGSQEQHLEFASVSAQDSDEKEAEIFESSFPSALSYFDREWAAVKVATDTRFLLACWTNVAEGAESCSWIYL